jgi:uncharacterized membrane protein YhaH (DUF805 family)
MIDWYKKVVFENYANFSGRARRSEYWYFTLMNILILLSLIILGAVFMAMDVKAIGYIFMGLYIFYALAMFIPNLGVIVRRFHDTGKSGWYYFMGLIPFVGAILVLVALCTEGDNGENDYGYDPKQPMDEINEIGQETGY